jgi:hypothetical protein
MESVDRFANTWGGLKFRINYTRFDRADSPFRLVRKLLVLADDPKAAPSNFRDDRDLG